MIAVRRRPFLRAPLLAAAALIVALAVPALADESPTPRPTPQPTATPVPHTLAELARTMRLKHRDSEGKITITNKNLSHYAEEGGITTVTGTPTGAVVAAGAAVAAPVPGQQSKEEEKRAMWRQRYTDEKQKIQDLEERQRELEKEIPGLWNDFYKWDDPAYRDGVIKPKLDAAMAELDQVKKELAEEQGKPGEILDEARKDGAQPGWFRDLQQGPPPTPAP